MKHIDLLLGIGGSLLITAPLYAQKQMEVGDNRQPNIIFIMADDLGWTDLGIAGSDYYETPNIDRLAAQGMRFDNAYAAAANSAPSRACFMTGLYTPRHGIFTVSPSERGPKSRRKLIPVPTKKEVDAHFITMAEALQKSGYECGHIGKWHLGDEQHGTGPLSQGFISNVGGDMAGSPYSYFYPYCKPQKNKCHLGLEEGEEGEYLTDRLTNVAVDFIQTHQDKPFFLYLSHYAVHLPLQAPQYLIDKYAKKAKGKYHTNPIYAAMVESLDQSVGKICQAVDSMGIAGNTLIVFYSDNGGSEPTTDNYPLRGGKGTPYEGGSRVPLIFKWKGKIAENTVSSVPVTGVDFYPTFVTLAGGKVSSELDGVNLFSLLKESNRSERDLFWHFPAYLEAYKKSGEVFRATPYSTVRSGNWKLIYYYENKSCELFNLHEDVSESKNLAEINIGKRDELYHKLMDWLEKVKAPVPVELNPYYIEK